MAERESASVDMFSGMIHLPSKDLAQFSLLCLILGLDDRRRTVDVDAEYAGNMHHTTTPHTFVFGTHLIRICVQKHYPKQRND
jgi:hypothetical protein